jgi:PAS domain S-box-containing protein
MKKSLLEKLSRKELEEKVLKQEAELKAKNGQIKQGAVREKFAVEQIHIQSKAMNATVDGIFIIDSQKSDFPIIYANQSFQILTGYAKNEIVGKDYFSLYGVDADSRVIEEIKQTLRQGKFFRGEMLGFRKDGKSFWSSLRIAPVRDASGASTHYVGVQTDTSLMKQRDLELEEKRSELLHVTRVGMLAEFVSSLAHEISQPLAAILSYAEAAQRIFAGREPELQEILQYIINDNQRATDVVQRLRILLKKSKPTFEPLDINILVKDTVELAKTHIMIRNIALKFELDRQLPLVPGDRIQLQQVLLNLISNSLEAMEESGDFHELLIRTSSEDAGTMMIEVKDSGSGISAQSMSKLFTHFFTSKPNGLGMGLAISRSIIEAHGGRLEAKNNPAGGAIFYFTLPVGKKDTL